MQQKIKKKILILEPFTDQGRSIAKFIKKNSDDYYIIGGLEEKDRKIKKIPFFDSLIVINIDSSLRREDYLFILPTGARSTYKWMQLNDSIKIGEILYKSENLQVFNKLIFLQKVKELGIPIPITYDCYLNIKNYPVFFKQRFEKGGGDRGILYNDDDFPILSNDTSIFFQEYIESSITYGVGFLSHEGNIITSFIHKEILSYPKTGGSGVLLERFFDDKLIDYSEKILKSINYSGWGLIEFKYCPKRNDYVFMEVNAKFWASIEFALINNEMFFQKLFDIHYEKKKPINCMIFLDRLVTYGFFDFLTQYLFHIKCEKVNHLQASKILIFNSIPYPIKKLFKRLFHD
jgi:hypothetical protein